mmetsp:Transcript_15073/g.29623  ORF Transcript_15073/g.29623 Transcript_15073/m.29623 type:complete len:206 (+) Transcript_15073:58-675(+)|eukprot:CAMPEP_0175131736 /NCGR_PEP_ID=MMETSP0087-20121206/6706_1 /TAXON_ID=136419 /ORGANISM="Unknown Unknown, Strain D1" /LENGTH=205 /DNA_ID=CAMNT_0016414055 /DNA_START=66 /DNA_END=683 /DNA_ORIENTATION=-
MKKFIEQIRNKDRTLPPSAVDDDCDNQTSPEILERKEPASITKTTLTQTIGYSATMMESGIKVAFFVPIDEGRSFKKIKDQRIFVLGVTHSPAIFRCAVKKQNQAFYLMSIKDITDVYVGKHMLAFQHSVAQGCVGNCCCSVVARDSDLHFEAQSPEVLREWLGGLQNLIATAGKQTVYDCMQSSSIDEQGLSLQGKKKAKKRKV